MYVRESWHSGTYTMPNRGRSAPHRCVFTHIKLAFWNQLRGTVGQKGDFHVCLMCASTHEAGSIRLCYSLRLRSILVVNKLSCVTMGNAGICEKGYGYSPSFRTVQPTKRQQQQLKRVVNFAQIQHDCCV